MSAILPFQLINVLTICLQVQAIFGHLACSRLQYYVPRGLWRHFKLQGIIKNYSFAINLPIQLQENQSI